MKITNVVYLAIKKTELCNKSKNKSPISSGLLMHQPTGPTLLDTPQHLKTGGHLTLLNTSEKGSHFSHPSTQEVTSDL